MQTLQTSGEATTKTSSPINKGMSKKDLSVHKCLPLFLKTILLSIAIISILALASCDDESGNGSNDGGGGSSTPKTFTLTHVYSVKDVDTPPDGTGSYRLSGKISLSAAIVGNTTYFFATGEFDDGVSVFSVDNQGKLTHVASVDDADTPPAGTGSYELDGAISLSTAEIASNTYLFVAGANDDGVSVFKVADNGILSHVDSADDGDDAGVTAGGYKLDGPHSLNTTEIAGNTYLFVAGAIDDGISVFKVADNGKLTHVDSVDDSDTPPAGTGSYELDGAISLSTAEIASNTYLFVAGFKDNGVSVFKVADNGKLTHVASVDDNNDTDDDDTKNVDESLYRLKNVRSINTAEIAGNTYLFVAGRDDNGVSVFKVADNGKLTHVNSVDDNNDADDPDTVVDESLYRLQRTSSLSTAEIASNTYLFVAGAGDDGVSVFKVADNGILSHVVSVDDNNNTDDPDTVVDESRYQLAGAYSVNTAEIAGNTYLFVAGGTNYGVSVFKISLE